MRCMTGLYDRTGKLCTKVNEIDRTFIVDKAPLEILEDTIRNIGFNLKGAMATAKWITGVAQMCPIMINPILKICVFPTKSAHHDEVIWFNPAHIARTSSLNGNTLVEFRNGTAIIVPCRLSAFNTKLQTAEQLKHLTIEAGRHPISFVIEPKQRPIRKKRKTRSKVK